MTAFAHKATFEGDAVAGDKIVYRAQAVTDRLPDPPRQLPLDVDGFTGRTELLSRLDDLLAGHQNARAPLIIVLTGMPGIGKTALAVHWAHKISDEFPDGQIFINLRGYSDRAALSPSEALGQGLRALGVQAGRIPTDEDELAALFRSQLARRRLLVLLDDAASSTQVRPLLPGTPSCVVVVTARHDLPGLVAQGRARTLALGLLPAAEAVELVRAVAGSDRTEQEPEATEQLVRLCARLPLALGIAAANLAIRPQQSVADAVKALAVDDRLSNLTLGGDPEGAVEAAFDLSYRGLRADHRTAFRLLGLVEGPSFTPEAIGALLAVAPVAAFSALNKLQTANLVQVVSPDRYQLHELLREYARSRSELEDERLVRESAIHRLATWYLTRAREAGRFLDRYRRTIGQEIAAPPMDVTPAERSAQLQWFDAEYRNLIEVVGQTSALCWDQLTCELADAVYDFFELSRLCHENLAVHKLGLKAAERLGHLPSQFFMHHHLAVAYRELGLCQKAFQEAEIACRLSGRVGDRYGEAAALDNIARIHLHLSDYRESLIVARDALSIRRETGDRHGEATTLDTMARGYQGLSAYQEAFDRAAEALEIRQEIRDTRGEAESLDNIARIYQGWGRASLALDCTERALSIRRAIRDEHGEAETLSFLGFLYIWLGRHSEARENVEQALRIHRSITDPYGEGYALVYLSTILRRLDQLDEAVHAGLEALDVLQELGDRKGEAQALDSLSRSYRHKRSYDDARRDARRALEISRQIGDRSGEATALNALALIDRVCGKLGEARKRAVQSQRLRHQIEDSRGEANSLDLLAKVYRTTGLLEKAHRTAVRACASAAEAEDWHGKMVSLRVLAEISQEMGNHEEALRHVHEAMELEKMLGFEPARRSKTLRTYRKVVSALEAE